MADMYMKRGCDTQCSEMSVGKILSGINFNRGQRNAYKLNV